MRRRSPEPALVAAARAAGVTDPRVLEAVAAVPRAAFVSRSARRHVDEDRPIPIGEQQTTSQPSLIASMLASLHLDGHERVLEVGTGTGYEAALLSHLAAEVHTVERYASLAQQARENLAEVGCTNVHVHVGDGTQGWPAAAPFEAIIVAAATSQVPQPLVDQLADGGRLLAPVGGSGGQELIRYVARDGQLHEDRRIVPVRFVPLVPERG